MQFEYLNANLDECRPDEPPVYFGFTCPKRTDGFMCSGLVIRGNPEGLNPPNKTWILSGPRDAPTLSPSVDCKGCAHGWLENGVWRNA